MTSQLKTSVTVNDSAVVDGQTIDAADVTVAFDDVQTELQQGWSRVSANDTHVKHLEDAVTGGTGISVSTANDGANETLSVAVDDTVVATTTNSITMSGKTLTTPTIGDFTNATHDHEDAAGGGQIKAAAVDSETATNGYVLTANGSGGAAWASAAGGGAQPVDITVTAGEALALRDYVFVDTSDGQAYKVDTDATPIKNGSLRGFVTESGGIASAATGTVRILGEVTGFSGLTAWNPVYASATAGGYTQTKPSPSSGGAQIAIVPIGIATSTTAILALNNEAVQYMKRDTVADDGTLTITHHTDAAGYNRRLDAYISDTVAGSSLASYADTNQDADFDLEGPSGAGGTLDVNGSGSIGYIGDFSNTEIRQAQQFTPQASGILSQFKFTLVANDGTPTGGISWEIRADNSDEPTGALLDSGGPVAVTPSAENTVNVTDGPFLDGSTKYWLVLFTQAQSTDNRYVWQRAATDVYASHLRANSSDAGSTWATFTQDFEFEITTSALTEYDKLAQSFQVTGAQTVGTVDLWLKKVGSPTGNLTVEIQPDSAGAPSGTAVSNGTSGTVAASTLTTSYADITFSFATPPSLSGSTTYWLVLKTTDSASNTNYVQWGADTSTPGYADGSMSGEASASWSALSADAVFEVFSPGSAFVEPANGGFSTAGSTDGAPRVVYAHHDGSYADASTKSTVKNVSGGSIDLTFVVEV